MATKLTGLRPVAPRVTALARGLTHQDGRRWSGYLGPTDLPLLAAAGAMFSPGDLARAENRRRDGECNRWHIGFDIKANSELDRLLSEQLRRSRGKGDCA